MRHARIVACVRELKRKEGKKKKPGRIGGVIRNMRRFLFLFNCLRDGRIERGDSQLEAQYHLGNDACPVRVPGFFTRSKNTTWLREGSLLFYRINNGSPGSNESNKSLNYNEETSSL